MDQHDHLSELAVDANASHQLKEVAKWGKFLAIVGFIGCVLILVIGIVMAISFSEVSSYERETLGAGYKAGYGLGIVAVYIVIAVLWFFPCLYLFQSAIKVRNALESSDQGLLNEGLAKLKACFRFWGIMTIIILSFYGIGLLVIGLGAIR
jgi:hypothetical protein